jgi:hypothetical protein
VKTILNLGREGREGILVIYLQQTADSCTVGHYPVRQGERGGGGGLPRVHYGDIILCRLRFE